MTSKTTRQGSTVVEEIVYEYTLQNRLSKVTTTPYSGGTPGTPVVVEYRYNPSGIRIEKTETTSAGRTETHYLVDPQNHTGYAQVLEETIEQYDSSDVFLGAHRIQYTIGDDVISQTRSEWSGSIWQAAPTQYLLYDGHGSTRQLLNTDGTVQDSYSYDGYGVMLSDGSGAEAASNADTSLLYAGEQYDGNLDQYYLRARYYNPANGLFNRVDPYAGNLQDPQSLHKYLYCHANPVNGIDPTGMEFSIGNVVTSVAIIGTLTTIFGAAITGVGLTYGAADSDGIPDAVILTVSGYGMTMGAGAEVGGDLIYMVKTRKCYLFGYLSAGFTPVSYFKKLKGNAGISFMAGAIWNMNSIDEWSGTSLTATWPASIIHLLPQAMFSKWKMWGALTQLAKKEHNTKLRDKVVQIDVSTSGPVALKVGFRSNTFSAEGGITSKPIEILDFNELGDTIAAKLRKIPEIANDLSKAYDIVE